MANNSFPCGDQPVDGDSYPSCAIIPGFDVPQSYGPYDVSALGALSGGMGDGVVDMPVPLYDASSSAASLLSSRVQWVTVQNASVVSVWAGPNVIGVPFFPPHSITTTHCTFHSIVPAMNFPSWNAPFGGALPFPSSAVTSHVPESSWLYGLDGVEGEL